MFPISQDILSKLDNISLVLEIFLMDLDCECLGVGVVIEFGEIVLSFVFKALEDADSLQVGWVN